MMLCNTLFSFSFPAKTHYLTNHFLTNSYNLTIFKMLLS
ncbi:hypothetical protein CSB69_2482 [Morganella morganii]|nr:hypothetical protein CSB69_2482 [Morganella morganii]EMP50632.1 hypothetical protein C790_02512 [Morganella morganii SC01]